MKKTYTSPVVEKLAFAKEDVLNLNLSQENIEVDDFALLTNE
jgi:hypothetical protein